jgi:PAS domain S-box-containing protein
MWRGMHLMILELGNSTCMATQPDSRTILLIDDTSSNLSIAANLLENRGYRVAVAQDGEEGVHRAVVTQPDLIMLDVMLPGVDGFEICRMLKAQESTRDIPVIFMTALAEPESKVRGFEAGGVDYVTKPLQIDEVIARVETHLKLHAMQRQLEAQNLLLEQHSAELERRVAERTRALTESECQFRTLAENLPDHIVRYDSTCHATYFNPAITKNLAQEFQPVLGMAPDLSHASIKPAQAYQNLLEKVLATGESDEMELDVQDTDGAPRTHHVRMVAERDSTGTVVGVLTIGRDITERRRSERALQESERRYREIFENSADALYLIEVTPEGRFRNLAFNAAFEKSTGLSREMLIGRDAGGITQDADVSDAVVAQETARVVVEKYRNCFKAGVTIEADSVLDLPSGHRHYHSSLVPLRDASGRIYRILGMARDITHHKQMERRLEASQRLLRQLAARNEDAREDERRHLKREIHDELGQYLSALRLGISIVDIQLGKIHSPLQEKTRRLIDMTDVTIKVVRNVVAALRPSALDLGIVSALEWLADEYSERFSIQCELQVAEDDLDMDDKRATAVFRVVQESLTNIARHAQATQVKISLKKTEGNYLLEVQDNGCGFDATLRKEDSFGLVSMRERALMLGGDVEINSAPGRTTITLHFPAKVN